ncbi:hypothetical protein A374_15262 [Fictibacillus macauensis ZFHKF-1]|uniref:YqzE-like protein n=1 Tax=Fictibacillus macauensis ZFHKF-1 TaxID=1196324 RepID=I8IYG0_9BACL|nr:YqzE family protein [Fictibacillus macauensis]EIT84496.1 hypothetical protein A374_15262 [Fictibacillus macauensis ZFHKF-1]
MNPYVKFLVESLVQRMNVPSEEKAVRKQQKKEKRKPLSVTWFGMMPLAFKMAVKRKRKK